MKKPEIKYHESELELVFQKLISGWEELIDFYNSEVKFDYDDPSDRLSYTDMADIAKFIVDKKKLGQTESFDIFFDNVEDLIVSGDNHVKNLIVIGLFEAIQNMGGSDIDYYKSFDKWLRNNSLQQWRQLIDYWEGTDWKESKESAKILNKNKLK